MGNTNLERVQHIKYLGVILDEQFTWKPHILYLRKKLSSSCGVLSKLRHYVDVETLKKVYYALVQAHLQYSIICWGSANKTSLQPLKIIQNRAIRHMYRVPRYTRLDYLYLNLRILKLDDLFELELGKFMHQFHNKKITQVVRGIFSRSRQITSTQYTHCQHIKLCC